MGTLAEIEAATDALSEQQKKELFEYLAMCLGHWANPDLPGSAEKRPLPFPLVKGTPGVVINPTKEQLDDY